MRERVARWLGVWPDTTLLDPIADVRPSGSFALPSGGALEQLLSRMDVPPHAIVEICEGAPRPDRDPEAWWILERLYERLVGSEPLPPPWPGPWPNVDPTSRFFHLYVLLGAVGYVRGLHAARGISEHVTWETLSDVGLQIARYQTEHVHNGFDGAFWIWEHFRGHVFRIGRLQYALEQAAFDPSGGAPFASGDDVIGVHIPAVGPLSPDAVEGSLSHARRFFAEHFSEASFGAMTCSSWLLDETLGEYLPETSNVVRFQRRFEMAPGAEPANEEIVRYVFGKVPASLDELPQETSLQRAVVAHLKGGGTWRIRHGWIA